MHPSSLLSFYPNYQILDSILSKGSYNKINLFIDLKNALQTVYLKHAVENIVENTIRSNHNDTSVFTSVLPFISFHKLYSIKRQIDVNFYFFFETGQSYYHKNLNKKYKISRQIDELYGLSRDKRELFTEVMQSNFQLIEKALNFLPNVTVFRLEHLEADFIPYFLTSRNYVGSGENECNIIYSNDHDLHQSCNDNTFIFAKTGKKKSIITKEDVMTKFLGVENDISHNYLPFCMSITGDTGDDVGGIKGIGPKTVYKNFDDLTNLFNNDLEELYDNVMKGNEIFNKKGIEFQNKYINKVVEHEDENKLISRNLKQVSFELISRYVENPDSTEMIKRRDKIFETLNNSKKATLKSFKKSLEMNRVFLEGDELEIIYYDFLKGNKTDDF